MNVRELALVTFSIFGQMAVGSFVVLGIVHFFSARKAGVTESDRLSDRALLVIGPVLVIGMIASLGHLGNPLNAPTAVTNLASSWLSREIFFSSLFALFGAIFALMQWRKISTFAVRNVVAWLAALVGLALVFSMSRVYMIAAEPAWNTWATPVLFFTTTFLLGALAMGAVFVANYAYLQKKEPGCAEIQCTLLRDTTRWIALVSIILLGVELITIPLQTAFLATTGEQAATTSLHLLFAHYGLWFALRLVLVFIGAGIFGIFLYRNAMTAGLEKSMGNMVYAAFALVLVAEVVGRFLFYITQARIGI